MKGNSKRKLNMARAISEAIAQEMRRDNDVFCMGEDIRHVGGIWGHTAGLHEEFGDDRIMDTPISETAFIGAGAVVRGTVLDRALMVGVPAKRIDWVCNCGCTLTVSDKTGTCESCNRRYRIEESGAQPFAE